jgi:hypothetical protein
MLLLCTSAVGLGCVKTSFKSKFATNLRDFRKLQFAKALISLKLKFWRLGFKRNLIRSLTFSHSFDPELTLRIGAFITSRKAHNQHSNTRHGAA